MINKAGAVKIAGIIDSELGRVQAGVLLEIAVDLVGREVSEINEAIWKQVSAGYIFSEPSSDTLSEIDAQVKSLDSSYFDDDLEEVIYS